MTEQECLEKMVAPGTPRPGKYRSGVIQILVTSACNLSCFNCTQASNFAREGKPWFMTPEQFEQAVKSLGFKEQMGNWHHNDDYPNEVYFGVVGLFGGNPAISPHFNEYCDILRRLVPLNQRGIWCNNPITVDNAREMALTFDPSVSNLNVHLDREAYRKFVEGWPECRPVGLDTDSRHPPVFVAMKDVVVNKIINTPLDDKTDDLCREAWGRSPLLNELPHRTTNGYNCRCVVESHQDDPAIYDLISRCDINQHWSAMIGVFRGELRAWFCEVAGAQAILHQNEPGYPDTGMSVDGSGMHYYDVKKVPFGYSPVQVDAWWKLSMGAFHNQVRKHCFECGVPLKGYGELAQAKDKPWIDDSDPQAAMAEVLDETHTPSEQVSQTHYAVAKPKSKHRRVEVVTDLVQLDIGKIGMVTKYLQNAKT